MATADLSVWRASKYHTWEGTFFAVKKCIDSSKLCRNDKPLLFSINQQSNEELVCTIQSQPTAGKQTLAGGGGEGHKSKLGLVGGLVGTVDAKIPEIHEYAVEN